MGLGEIRLGEMGLGEMGLGEMGQNRLGSIDASMTFGSILCNCLADASKSITTC